MIGVQLKTFLLIILFLPLKNGEIITSEKK